MAKDYDSKISGRGRPRVTKKNLIFTGAIAVLVCILAFALSYQDRFFDKRAERGVSVYHAEKMQPGLTMYGTKRKKIIWLIDNNGELLHQWKLNRGKKDVGFQHVELKPDGNILVIVKDTEILELSPSSKIEWDASGGFHHDLDIAANKDLYVLERGLEFVEHQGEKFKVLGDSVAILGPSGERKSSIPLTPIFLPLLTTTELDEASAFARENRDSELTTETPADVFHTNSIEIIDRDLDDTGSIKKGDLLISARTLDELIIVRPETEEIVWRFGPGILEGQHHASLLESGNILVFDNGTKRGYSRVLEINPLTKKIEWMLDKVDGEPFYSSVRGSAQRLANGNTLVTSGNHGVAFEATHSGELVWLFKNPKFEIVRSHSDKHPLSRLGVLYRVTRVPETLPFLTKSK